MYPTPFEILTFLVVLAGTIIAALTYWFVAKDHRQICKVNVEIERIEEVPLDLMIKSAIFPYHYFRIEIANNGSTILYVADLKVKKKWDKRISKKLDTNFKDGIQPYQSTTRLVPLSEVCGLLDLSLAEEVDLVFDVKFQSGFVAHSEPFTFQPASIPEKEPKMYEPAF